MKEFFHLLFSIKILIHFSSLCRKGHDTAIDFHIDINITIFNSANVIKK